MYARMSCRALSTRPGHLTYLLKTLKKYVNEHRNAEEAIIERLFIILLRPILPLPERRWGLYRSDHVYSRVYDGM